MDFFPNRPIYSVNFHFSASLTALLPLSGRYATLKRLSMYVRKKGKKEDDLISQTALCFKPPCGGRWHALRDGRRMRMFALALPRLYIRRLLHRFREAPSRREPNLEFLISQDVHGFGKAGNVKCFINHSNCSTMVCSPVFSSRNIQLCLSPSRFPFLT